MKENQIESVKTIYFIFLNLRENIKRMRTVPANCDIFRSLKKAFGANISRSNKFFILSSKLKLNRNERRDKNL